jgi:hypothetical protein
VSILFGGGPQDWFGRGRRCAKNQQPSAIEYGQRSITSFYDDNATSGKAESCVSGVDL